MSFGRGHVDSSGPRNARLAIIGEAPGPTEIDRGFPMAGWTGDFVNRALGGQEQRNVTFVTNASRCLPPDYEKDSKIFARIEHYRPALEADLASLDRCQTLLCCGKEALQAITGSPHISEFHGSVLNRREVEAVRQGAGGNQLSYMSRVLPPSLRTVVFSFHPAFTTRGLPQFRPMIATAIRRAKWWAHMDQVVPRWGEESFNLIPTPDEVKEFLDENPTAPLVVDVETPWGEPQTILLCGIACNGKTLVFPWTTPYRIIMRHVLESNRPIVGHNFFYDMAAFYAYGIRCADPIWDTINAGAILWPPTKSKKDQEAAGQKRKKTVSARWLSLAMCTMRVKSGYYFWKQTDYSGNPMFEMPALYKASYPWCPDEFHERLYCGLDCLHTEMLWYAVEELMKQKGML